MKRERESGNCVNLIAREIIEGQRVQINNNDLDKIKRGEEFKELFRNKTNAAFYLTKERPKRIKVIARYRLGNETKVYDKWIEKENRKCRLCGEKDETVKHIEEECKETKKEGKKLLDETGKNLAWMMEINWKRNKKFRDEIQNSRAD